MPIWRHFLSRQAWHWLRWALSITQWPLPAWHLINEWINQLINYWMETSSHRWALGDVWWGHNPIKSFDLLERTWTELKQPSAFVTQLVISSWLVLTVVQWPNELLTQSTAHSTGNAIEIGIQMRISSTLIRSDWTAQSNELNSIRFPTADYVWRLPFTD